MDRDLNSTLLHLTRVRLTQDFPAQINACIDVLSDEELWWRPNEQANAVANLVMHLSWSNRYYLEQAIGGRDIGRNREAEFTARDRFPKPTLLETWRQSLRVVEEILDGLQPSQMMDTTDRTGKATTYGQISAARDAPQCRPHGSDRLDHQDAASGCARRAVDEITRQIGVVGSASRNPPYVTRAIDNAGRVPRSGPG